MSVAINKFNYKLPYEGLFGGVIAMTNNHFVEVNGFSNRFWGWGGEDDDLGRRIKARGLKFARSSSGIARYSMLKHKKAKPSPKRWEILEQNPKMYEEDGLNSIQQFQHNVKKVITYRTHTFISVSFEQQL